ncbi:MAG: nucleoside deaminase [Gammaproteobacteria bacterium]
MSPIQKLRLRRLSGQLGNYQPQAAAFPDDPLGVAVCRLAISALAAGNYGVGAVIADDNGQILIEAANGVFTPAFRSDGHAEMLAVDALERRMPDLAPMSLTLCVSLEPCPMCFTRLKLAGIGRIRYLSADRAGGMAHLSGRLPKIWRLLNPEQDVAPSAVSPELQRIAWRLFLTNLRALRRKLVSRFQEPA